MENQNQVQGPKIDLKNSTGLKNSEDKSVFLNGVFLEKYLNLLQVLMKMHYYLYLYFMMQKQVK